MTLAEILPAVRELSKRDKRRLAEFLSQELQDSEAARIFKPGAVYSADSPYDEVEAAKALQTFLDSQESQS